MDCDDAATGLRTDFTELETIFTPSEAFLDGGRVLCYEDILNTLQRSEFAMFGEKTPTDREEAFSGSTAARWSKSRQRSSKSNQ